MESTERLPLNLDLVEKVGKTVLRQSTLKFAITQLQQTHEKIYKLARNNY